MFEQAIDALDRAGTLEAAARVRARVLEAEATEIRLAVHWANLHAPDAGEPSGAVLPGTERSVRLGHDGTPEVAEFAAAELAAVLGTTATAARS